MRIQPRQQLLETWRSLIAVSFKDDKWIWAGGDEPDSVLEAQQVLCLMTPATEIDSLRFNRPDETAEDVLSALRGLGDTVQIPRNVVRILTEYMERHRGEDGPLFDGESYLVGGEKLPAESRRFDMVEGFSLSVTLSLATLGFVREFRRVLTRPELIDAAERLDELAGERLTAALVGLLRSFAVDGFESDSPEGQVLLEMINQSNRPAQRVALDLRQRLRDVTASLRDLRLGSGEPGDLDRPSRLYQVGWSWGVVEDAPKIEFVPDTIPQRGGSSYDAPFLYFTVVALDGIADLFTLRTLRLGLLDSDQQRLAQALQIRWELTQQYWSTLATFDPRAWPLEDLPWRTVDKVQEDYYSLLVTAITIRELASSRVSDERVFRLGEVIRELSNRARITRRPLAGDPAVRVHDAGIQVSLTTAGSDSESELAWSVAEFSALLLKRSVRVVQLLSDITMRGQMIEVMDKIWDHVSRRQFHAEPIPNLWDQPSNVYEGLDQREPAPAWQTTLRVVESLVLAADLVSDPPIGSGRVTGIAEDMLAEAEQLYDQELLRGGVTINPRMRDMLRAVNARMGRAREILDRRPASAVALLSHTLQELDALDSARHGDS